MAARPPDDPSPAIADRRLIPVAPPEIRKLCLLGLVGLLGYLGTYGGLAVYYHSPDFEYFYNAGHWLVHHGVFDPGFDRAAEGAIVRRGTLDWYLPFVPRLMSLLGWMPFWLAGGVWLALNLALLVALLRMMGRNLTGLPPQDWPVTQVLLVVLLILFWSWEFRLNQINTLTLFLVVASFVLWQRGQASVAGFWLGLAVLLKVTPGLIVLWFALKRQWRVVLAAAATFLAAGPLSDVLAFGGRATVEIYQGWFQRALGAASHSGLIRQQREMDWRNQSLSAVASHWLHPTDFSTHFDNDPRMRYGGDVETINVVSLSRETIVRLVTAVVLISLGGLVWLGRRPARAMTTWELRLEWALFVAATLWFMPVMRRYHMIALTPLLAVLAACVHHVGHRARWSQATIVCTGFVVVAQLCVLTRWVSGSHLFEGAGVLLLCVPALAAPAIALRVLLARNPSYLPEATAHFDPSQAVAFVKAPPPGPAPDPAGTPDATPA